MVSDLGVERAEHENWMLASHAATRGYKRMAASVQVVALMDP